MKALLAESPLTEAQIARRIARDAARVRENLAQLSKEGLIRSVGKRYKI